MSHKYPSSLHEKACWLMLGCNIEPKQMFALSNRLVPAEAATQFVSLSDPFLHQVIPSVIPHSASIHSSCRR